MALFNFETRPKRIKRKSGWPEHRVAGPALKLSARRISAMACASARVIPNDHYSVLMASIGLEDAALTLK